MDGIGLTLRPELDGRYTVAGVVELDGKPSVPDVTSGDVLLAVDGAPVPGATMGQVWSLLAAARTNSFPDFRARWKALQSRCDRSPVSRSAVQGAPAREDCPERATKK